ncbi:MAG: ATP cone domain-containing protein, partial [Planctomycetota bacterium]|nr:ATP cone domain-containing protein [Planctomycetota bacterium]
MSENPSSQNEHPVSARPIERVKKKNGSIVPYEEEKISLSISQAASEVGNGPSTLGQDLAGVVSMYLERYYEKEVPSSDEIRKMVDKILRETGHTEVADSYAERRGLPVGNPEEDLFPDELLLVEGTTRDEVRGWGRERISAAIVKEAGLDQAEADEIASAVEKKIFSIGQRRVSTTLIREQVNHELLTRGYGTHLRKQLVVGLPKYDLSLLIGGEGAVPR